MDNGEDTGRLSASAVAGPPVSPEELLHERVRRFMRLLPEVLNSESVEAVHDLRVWSRRLQQVLTTIFPRTGEDRAGSLIRALRRARRGLSGWRDCDVLIALLNKRLRRLGHSDELRAWQVVDAYLSKRREKEIRQARRRLAKRELFLLPRMTEDLLKEPEGDIASKEGGVYGDFIFAVAGSIKAASGDWRAALIRAAESVSQEDTHGFRIKTKQLRYRLELARDLGHEELQLQLSWLKRIQDSLGLWHDRAELARIATEAVAGDDFLFKEPRSTSLLLKRLARERLAEASKVKSLLDALKDSSELQQLEAWIANHDVSAALSRQEAKGTVSDQ